ncbi:MAG: Eco57I restriction-modification methylase domain-containing protein [Candidatus Jettenia caeni]|nr:MAG: Eco57I restriction-modification methylase domain-containing protein [Candidatus Jettenia caeni]
MSEQEKLFFLKNQKLFSHNYLEYRLQSTSLWNVDNEKVLTVFENIKHAYKSIQSLKLSPGEEANLEDKFIRPVLAALGYEWDVQPTTQRGAKKKRPDYALFKDKNSHKEARKEKDNPKYFYTYPLTILEAKYWGRSLNDTDPKDILDNRDPTAQIVKYLDDVYYASNGRIQWAILTNGKVWRLFSYRATSRSGNYYEVDLEEIINSNNPDTFKYFYLFFSKDAFIPDLTTGKTWLDQHMKGSEDYAARVSETLKNLIFDKIFEDLAKGFIEYRYNEKNIKKETEEDLKEIFNGCLTLLYRLLFLLYAESRALLPVNDQNRYYKKSLKRLKEDIANELEITVSEGMSHQTYDYWSRLESLCRIIDRGDKALNIPIYNGGLFETPPESFLATNKISDPFLAEAIALLTIDQQGEYTPGQKSFIDYSSLDVRHLGNIYEGLLEFHIRIADEPMVEIKEGSKLLWKKESEIDANTRIQRRKEKGEIYIENSKHERKATGSYYTPHYIAEYIVKNTVGPVLETRFQKAQEILSALEILYEKQRKQLKKPKGWKYWNHPGEPQGPHIDEIVKLEDGFFETVFDLKVLDPAMGSGHFLVHTVDFITDKIIAFLANFPENPVIRKIEKLKHEILDGIKRQGVSIDESKLTEVNLIKRTVMKRCIYGVDLNEMAVELTKLSLWLDSFTLGAPLSFLDHHLKYGNSLIGSNLESLKNAVKGQLFTINLEPLNRAIRNMLFVSNLSDATYQQVKDSEQKYRDADKNIGGYRILLDILVSEYFGIEGAKSFLLEKGSMIDMDSLKKSIESMHKKDREVIKSIEKVAEEKRFFHWEIEFPEVFFERVGTLEQKVDRKENPGFDCVVGNPPYDVIAEKEQGIDLSDEKQFFNAVQFYKHAVGGKLNFYRLFSVLSINLLHSNGFHGFIVPMAIMADAQAYPLRKFLLMENQFIQIEAFPQKDDPIHRVFFDAKLSTCIYIVKKQNPIDPFIIKIHPGKEILESSIPIELSSKEIQALDSENLSFPSFPSIKAEDILLALKLVKTSHGARLGDYAPSLQGEVNLTTHAEYLSDEPIGPEVLRGAHVGRYELHEEPKQGEPKYLNVSQYLEGKKSDSKAFDHRKLRIGYQRGSAIDNWRRIVATIIEPNNFCSDTINYITDLKDLDIYAVLALLNSRVLEWRFRLTSTNNHVNSYEVDSLSIPRISFTTSEKKRRETIEIFVTLYLSHKYDCITKNIKNCLPEKSDIVHDLLAYLARQMIEMNNKKDNEIKGFLKWLEREIGSEINELSNKTAIREYHEHNFNQLIETLKRNRGKLSIDPSDRKTQERLEDQFTQSISVLEPLKTKIKTTDDLIDEIVYRLYGLIEEEIKIVKGEVST